MMYTNKLVTVFWRADGSVLFEETWGTGPFATPVQGAESASRDDNVSSTNGTREGSPSGPVSPTSSEQFPISAATVWSLVQVFIQFSREVHGGNVQRLVFRDPVQPIGKRRGFGATPATSSSSQRPVLVHVAHDNLLAVTVTETVPATVSQLRPLNSDFPAPAFAQALLQYFAKEQAAFLERRAAAEESGRVDSSGERGSGKVTATGSGGNSQSRSPSARDGVSVSRSVVQRSYGSGTSESSFASMQSEYFSNESSGESSDQVEGPAVESTPMMNVDRPTVALEVQRILATCR